MIERVFSRTPNEDFGVMVIDGQEFTGPLPPNAGDLRALYDEWLAAGNTVEPFDDPQPPSPVGVWTPLEFMERFTYEERTALRALAKSDPIAEDWLDLLRASGEVRADDVRTMEGLSYMIAVGVLSDARVQEIMGP